MPAASRSLVLTWMGLPKQLNRAWLFLLVIAMVRAVSKAMLRRSASIVILKIEAGVSRDSCGTAASFRPIAFVLRLPNKYVLYHAVSRMMSTNVPLVIQYARSFALKYCYFPIVLLLGE